MRFRSKVGKEEEEKERVTGEICLKKVADE